MMKDLKSCTIYNNLNEKKIIKLNQQWIHGSLGVVTITRITKWHNLKSSTQIYVKTLKNKTYVFGATDYGSLGYFNKCNLLFQIKK